MDVNLQEHQFVCEMISPQRIVEMSLVGGWDCHRSPLVLALAMGAGNTEMSSGGRLTEGFPSPPKQTNILENFEASSTWPLLGYLILGHSVSVSGRS